MDKKLILIGMCMLILISLVVYNRNFILNDRLYCNFKPTDFGITKFDDNYKLSQGKINDLCKAIKSPTNEIDTKRPYLNITFKNQKEGE